MNVAIVNLTSRGLSGGQRKYLERLVPLLHQDPRVGRVTLSYSPEANCGVLSEGENRVLVWPRMDSLTGHAWLRRKLKGIKPDVIFIPTARWFRYDGCPKVIMVRNMEPLLVPFEGNSWAECLRNFGRAQRARRACALADRIVAVSHHVRNFLIQEWGIEEGKIGTVYHGADEPLCEEEGPRPAWAPPGLDTGFIFTAGSIRPARGLEDLVEAVGILSQNGWNQWAVIAGASDPGSLSYLRWLERLAEDFGVSNRIVWAGQLPAREMSWCLGQCGIFVVTSRVEACPNTVLEAMSHSCQIVSTSQEPMPEFLAGSAVYYKPRLARDLADKLRAVLEAPGKERRMLRDRARSRAHSFSWKECAARTIDQLVLAMRRR